MEEYKEKQEDSKSYHFLGTRTERIVFLFLLTLLSCGPIIFGKSIPSHADWHIHIEHAYNFKRCFWQGQFLPRWIDAHVAGYGLPIFNYYAPLVYYLFTFLELIFRNPVLSIKWTFIIPMICCTGFGYLYLRKHGSPVSSVIAMIFVIFSPAIQMYIYNHNWPGSTLAIAFLFLTLYGIDSFDKNKAFDLKSFLSIVTGYCGMALAHLATAFMYTLLLIPYSIFSLFIYRTKKFVKNIFLSHLLGACVAGFYLFPACLEKNLVHTDEVLTKGPLWDFSKNFLFTYLDRDKDDGFAWGIFDHRYYEVSNALFSLVALICIVILIVNMDKIKQYFKEPFRVKIAITMFIISFLMMTPVSIFVWLIIKPLQTVQFPWRFTTFILPFGVLSMVYAFDLVGKLAREKINIAGYKFLYYSIACLLSGLLFVDFINMYNWKWVPEHSLVKAAVNVLWLNEEYYPNLTGNPNWKQIDYRQDFSPSVESTNTSCDFTLLKWLAHERVLNVFSETEHKIRFRNFYFPGWFVYIDGKLTDISMDPKIGSMIVRVPAGKHEIIARFELTPIRKASMYISLLAFLIYSFLIFKFIKEKKIRLITNIQEEKTKDQNSLAVGAV